MIYLDYSANTPVDPAVLEAFCKAEQTYIGNPNSTHCAGRTACEEMARVTDHIAGLLGVEPAADYQESRGAMLEWAYCQRIGKDCALYLEMTGGRTK